MIEKLSNEEKRILLSVARETIVCAAKQDKLPQINLEDYSKNLQDHGATFVTLHTKRGKKLRGCIGSLEAYQPLILDVQTHAVGAALEDYRFQPVRPEEVDLLQIEISRLSVPKPLPFSEPNELPNLLNVGIDGVILQDGFRRATFLPQVWEQLPDPEIFLDHLCSKMGVDPGLWRRKMLEVFIYEVEEFEE